MDKDYVCCFSGHRFLPASELPGLMNRLVKTITGLAAKGVIYYGSGAAHGFDLIAANAVLRLRETNGAVKLIMVLPFRGQDERWSTNERLEYRRVINAADKVVCLSERYYEGAYEARNRHLVEHSGICVAYMTNERSGTGQTVRFAQARGLEVINLAIE